MSDELHDFQEQLEDIMKEVGTALQKDVAKASGKAKLEKCEYVRNRLNRAKQLYKSYNIELRELNRADQKPFEEKGQEYERELSRLNDELQWAMSSAERDDLFGGGGGSSSRKKGDDMMSGKPRNADEMTAKQLTNEAKTIQDQSKQSTSRAKQLLEQTIQVGVETTDVLRNQTDQLENVDKNMDMIESNLQRADRQIRIFARRMASDKVIMVLVLLVVLSIVAAIVVRVVRQKVTGEDANVAGIFDSTNNNSI